MNSHRKLTAILSADVAGYSRLMSDNERATLDTLTAYRQVIRERVERHGGRVVDAPGDALLAEFPSAVEAVECAMEAQAELGKRNAQLVEHRRMHFRFGINIGDVIEEGGALYGDGVNIAARLESLAAPGSLCISGNVFDQIEDKLPAHFEFMGEQEVKNIAKPVRAYRPIASEAMPTARASSSRERLYVSLGVLVVVGVTLAGMAGWQMLSGSNASKSKEAASKPLISDIPTIAVLPFQNISGDPNDEWFSDGMTDTLITDLSMLARLYVIARNSTFAYKGKAVDVRKVGTELGARYVLEGSVQRDGERLRVNAQLIDSQNGIHLWAERYDRELANLFEIQDEIVDKIVTELDVKIRMGEQAREWRHTTRNRQAYELFLRAEAQTAQYTREGFARARELLEKAIALDPKFTHAMVELGWAYYHEGDGGWERSPADSYIKAVALGEKAAAIQPSGQAYALIAINLLTLERHAEALIAADKALALSPNEANVLILSGWVLALTGRANEAIALIERAIRLNPITPNWYYGALGDALLLSGQGEEALVNLHKCADLAPDFVWCHLGLTVAYAELGKTEEAEREGLVVLGISPGVTAEDNTYVRSLSVREDREMAVTALRKSGLR